MRFPLGIVADYLEDEGYEVVRAPLNLREEFDWVTADADLSHAEGLRMLVVASTCCDVPADVPVVLLNADGPTLGLVPETVFGAVPEAPFELKPETAFEPQPKPPFEPVPQASLQRDNAFVCAGVVASPARVAQKIQLYLLSIYEWVERMHKALGSHCDCARMLELSEPMLKNYVSVTDSTFAYIAHTPGIAPIEEASAYLVEHGRYSDKVIEAVGSSGLAELWTKSFRLYTHESNAINPLPSVEHVYHLNNQYAAHLVMVCPKPITLGQEFLFGLLVGPIETILKGQWQTDNPFKQRYTTFLSNLMHEDRSNREVTYEIARVLGIPTGGGLFKVCVVDESWKGGSGAFFAARAMALVPGCMVFTEQDKLVLLLHARADAGKRVLSPLENKLFDLVGGLRTQVGVSRKFYDLLGCAAAFQEASIALSYGRICHKDFIAPGAASEANPDTYIYRFKRYFPFFVGDPAADVNTFIRRNNVATQVLGRIERDDVANGTSDIKVLRAYLYEGCSVSSACAALGMHRNSFSYRLRHIEKAYDLDLADADERAFLTTLFHLPRQ